MTAPSPATTPLDLDRGLRRDRGPSAGPDGDFVAVLRSEWVKFRSVRSTWWVAATTVVFMVGLSGVVCAAFAHSATANDEATTDLTVLTLTGVFLSQLAVGVLGVLSVSSEFGSGMIRTTFAAVPRRELVLAAKATVLTLALGLGATATCLVAFFVGDGILAAKVHLSFGDPGVARSVLGAGLYLTVVSLLGLAFGTIIRHTAGAISALVGVLIVLLIVVAALPPSLHDHLWKYLPANAGLALIQTQPDDSLLAPWTGFALMCGYAAAGLLIGAVLFSRRDA